MDVWEFKLKLDIYPSAGGFTKKGNSVGHSKIGNNETAAIAGTVMVP